jgi:hypothetical protein
MTAVDSFRTIATTVMPQFCTPVPNDDVDTNSMRSLQWLKKRLQMLPPQATWHNLEDVPMFVRHKANKRDVMQICAMVDALDLTKCIDNCCIYTKCNQRIRVFGERYTIQRLVHLLCSIESDETEQLTSFCPPPAYTFVGGILEEQTLSPDIVPNCKKQCINPRHTFVMKTVDRKKKRIREEETDDTTEPAEATKKKKRFVLTRKIAAEHRCVFMAGFTSARRPRTLRTQIPARRPAGLYLAKDRVIPPYTPPPFELVGDEVQRPRPVAINPWD